MKIVRFEPDDRRNRRAFINFPFKLYQDTPQWVPHLRAEMRKIFTPQYAFYNYGEAAFFLAKDERGEILGRLAVADNHRYNASHQSKTAFFYYFEVVDDRTAAEGLFSQGCEWARKQGLDRILGPKGFTVLDGFGMLVKGFEYQPAFNQPYNLPYYTEFIESLGFTKVKDILTGRVDKQMHFPEKILRAAHLVEERKGFRAPMIKTKAELRAVIDDFKRLYNESLAGPSGNAHLTDEDVDNMASQLLWIADPRLVKLIYKDEQPIGWILGYPDIGRAIQCTKGRLFPFGWLQIMIESKRSNWIDMNGIGIIKEYQRLGGTAVLYNEIYKSIMNIKQYDYAELLQMREENINILLEAANIDIDFHKVHRLYEKSI